MIDVNECSRNSSNCSQVCINNVGGFSCACYDGYTLNTDKATCDGKQKLCRCLSS